MQYYRIRHSIDVKIIGSLNSQMKLLRKCITNLKNMDLSQESVFEQMAIINYMSDENDDKRAAVIQALYTVYFKEYHGLKYAAEIYFEGADKIPQKYVCYLFGTDIDARISFQLVKVTGRMPEQG